jgi:hypothetical protein
MKIRKYFGLLLLLCFSVLFGYGCCTGRKVTKTETIIKIDTVIRYVPDTSVIRQVKQVDSILFHHDTLTVENEVAVSKVFWNPEVRKLEINLKGKVIDVPVQIDAKVKEKIIEKDNFFHKYWWSLIMTFLFIVFLILLFKIKFK